MKGSTNHTVSFERPPTSFHAHTNTFTYSHNSRIQEYCFMHILNCSSQPPSRCRCCCTGSAPTPPRPALAYYPSLPPAPASFSSTSSSTNTFCTPALPPPPSRVCSSLCLLRRNSHFATTAGRVYLLYCIVLYNLNSFILQA